MEGQYRIKLALLSIILSACGSQQTTEEIASTASDPRIQLKGTALNLERNDDGIAFKYVASVDAPKDPKSGEVVQATAFAAYKNLVVVVYNYAGPEVLGAIDVVDLSDWKSPKLLQTNFYRDAEFADVSFDGSRIYAVGNFSGEHEGAGLLALDLSKDGVESKEVGRIYFDDYVATSIVREKDRILVATGSRGHIYYVNASEIGRDSAKDVYQLPEAKYAFWYGGDIFGLGGEKGSGFYADAGRGLEEVAHLSDHVFEAPGRAVVFKDHVFTNAESLGFQIHSLKKWQREGVHKVSETAVKGTGNGISVTDKMAFLSQGDAGTAVFCMDDYSDPKFMGSFDFNDDRGSSNNVYSSKSGNENFLMIADGAGGFRIVYYEHH